LLLLGISGVLWYAFYMLQLSQETEALAKRLAAVKSLSVDDAVRLALEDSARSAGIGFPRDASPGAAAARRARLELLVAEIAAMPDLDPRSTEEIVDDLNAI
jgi:antitoxin VapB